MTIDKLAAAGGGIKNIAVGVGILAGVALVVYVLVKAKQGAAAVKEVVTRDLNPASDENLIYRGINALVPGEEATLGTWLYDLTH